ncbi:MAG TPA: ABC transporter ATP-binding protein [Candidatus Limnocylindrales bacterium]|nr:ABC transporter ATP-binding protein [Candidatus Limnocylindrales bacterium]
MALDAIDLRIGAGETVALLGPNGAGKSTAISLMLGLLEPSAGGVSVLGREPRAAVRSGRVGAMLQESGLPALARVRELVELVRNLSPRPMGTVDVLRRAGLTALAGRRTETLSSGEQQRVRFALAIAGNPDLLFLDEPTVAMDVESRHAFWADMRSFAEEGRTILFATHYLEEADQVASRIVVLDRGRIVADGTASQIKAATRGRRRIAFRTDSTDGAVYRALPAVTAVALRGDGAVLETTDSDATARALFASDLAIRDVEISGPDLEDAFLALIADGA